MSILEGELAAIIGEAIGGADLFYEATLTRTTVTEPTDPYDPSTGETITTEYPCSAIVETYSDFAIANSLVNASDRKILILATSIGTKPQQADTITIRGSVYTVISVETDPAKAVWEVRAAA